MPPLKRSISNTPDTFSVSELTSIIRSTLESTFQQVTVKGELSSWSVAPSGHSYFSIKDEGALLNCVMWRSDVQRLTFEPDKGIEVECKGRITLFEKRGQYQLNVRSMTEAGEGELWAKFLKLKKKLEEAGLFDQDRKREIPPYPKAIGVVTSPTGAVIRDIINVTSRRAPFLSIYLYPSKVQGDGAGLELAQAVEKLSNSGLIDVLIVGRGGGSAEDLWEFNDERLAMAIYNSPIPVVSAVGHETDFSISDFVADLRAPTPSAAAELVTAEYLDLLMNLKGLTDQADRIMLSRLENMKYRLRALLDNHILRQPELLLREYQQRVDSAMEDLPRIIQQRKERLEARLNKARGSLIGHNPELILKKGYAIVRDSQSDKVLMKKEQLKKNQRVSLQLQDGRTDAYVTDDDAPDLFS